MISDHQSFSSGLPMMTQVLAMEKMLTMKWIKFTATWLPYLVLLFAIEDPAQCLAQNLPSAEEAKQATEQTDETKSKTNKASASRRGVLLRVSLPITIASASQLKTALQQIADSAPAVAKPSQRLAVVLEFETVNGATGRGSELEACQLLARYLVSADLNRIETTAFIPAAKGATGQTSLSGHAILVAIAANQIAMEKNTSLKAAGIDEPRIDNLVREVYRGVASQRLTLPLPMVMALLDQDRDLYRVQTDIGFVFVDGEELVKLEQENKATDTKTLSKAGTPTELTSQDLEDFSLIRRQVRSKKELALSLNLPPQSLDQSPQFVGQWKAVQVNLPVYIDDRTATWVMRSMGSRLSRSEPPNLLILNLDNVTTEGSVDACFKLAQYLTELDSNKVQTAVFARGDVKGPAAVLALTGNQLLMTESAKLGGELTELDQSELTTDALADLEPEIKSLARQRQVDWSLMMSMLNPELEVNRYRHNQTGLVRLMAAEEVRELDDSVRWEKLGTVDSSEGLTATAGEQLSIVRSIVNDDQELRAFYQLEESPEILETTKLDRNVERFASFLSRPDIAALLLFLAVFMLSTEMSTPGLGVPGFLSAICFMLFFWSQHLEGNAGWLEVLLFVGGVSFILIEIFVTPGMGLFGVGGIAMVIASMILASQEFTFTPSDLEKLPKALIPLLGAALGFFTALFVLRNVLPHSPLFKKMILAPRDNALELSSGVGVDPEAIVDWSFLKGRQGEALTRLVPSGKAKIDGKVYDVITDGRMVDKGQAIKVVEAVGNRVVVVPTD